jgi:hypothetical protein
MARKPYATEAAVTRALKGAQNCGLAVYKYEIDQTGKIVVLTGKPEGANDAPADDGRNEWDGV